MPLPRHNSTACYLQRRTCHILLEQIERGSEEQKVLNEEAERQGHDRKSASLSGPAARQKGNDARGADEGYDRSKRAQDAKPRAPVAEEDESAEDR